MNMNNHDSMHQSQSHWLNADQNKHVQARAHAHIHTYLLSITCPRHACKSRARISSAQENGLELIHASIGKQQCGVIDGDDRAAWHSSMGLCLEKLDERAPHAIACRTDAHR